MVRMCSCTILVLVVYVPLYLVYLLDCSAKEEGRRISCHLSPVCQQAGSSPKARHGVRSGHEQMRTHGRQMVGSRAGMPAERTT